MYNLLLRTTFGSSASCTIFDNSVFAPDTPYDIWELRQFKDAFLASLTFTPAVPFGVSGVSGVCIEKKCNSAVVMFVHLLCSYAALEMVWSKGEAV